MNVMVVINERMKSIINSGEVIISTFYDPVSHCVGCKIDTIVTVGSSLTFFDIIRVNKSCGSAAQ